MWGNRRNADHQNTRSVAVPMSAVRGRTDMPFKQPTSEFDPYADLAPYCRKNWLLRLWRKCPDLVQQRKAISQVALRPNCDIGAPQQTVHTSEALR